MAKQFAFRLSQMPTEADPAQHVVSLLVGQGISPINANRLLKEELTIRPKMEIKKLTALLDGRPVDGGRWCESSEEEKTAGAKLVALLRWDGTSLPQPDALTEAQRELVIERRFEVVVRDNFLDRVENYASTPDQVTAILRILSPTLCGSDAAPDKTHRKIAAAAELLGITMDWRDTE